MINLILTVLIIMTAIGFSSYPQVIKADDNEAEPGLCARGYTDHCANNKLLHDLYGRLLLWNALCNPPINKHFCETGKWSDENQK